MSVEEDIKTALDAHVGLSALISDRSYTRFPQNPTYPAILYSRVSTNIQTSLDDLYAANPRISFDVVGKTYPSVRAVIAQLVNAMIAATTFTAIYISDIDLGYQDDLKIYRVAVDFSVWQQ